MQRHQFSIGVTLLGAIWPEFKHGRPTGASAFTQTGGLEVKEVHGVAYKMVSNTHLLLIIYTYRNRLNLILAAEGCHFTRAEAEEFMDLIMNNLLEGAH
jgi:hypothetical protein